MRPLTSYCVAVVIVFGSAQHAAAQAPTPAQLATPTPSAKMPDNLFVSGQTPIGGDSSSRGASVEWLHPMTTTTALQMGGTVGKSQSGWFSYLRAGGMTRLMSMTFASTVDLGGGQNSGNEFTYRRARGELTLPTGFTPLLAQAEADYISLAGNVATGLRLGAIYQVTSRLSIRANAHGYLSKYDAHYETATEIVDETGYVLNPAGSVRADYGSVKWKLLAGVFLSKRPALTTDAVTFAPSMHATRTTFAGLQVRAGAQDLIGVVDVSEQPGGRITTLMVSVKVPLQ